MYLTSANLPYFLLSRGLLSSQELITGTYSSLESRRRNRHFRVLCPGKPLFIKQLPAIFAEAVECSAREADCYRLIAADPRFAVLHPLMLRFHHYDPVRHILVIEFLAAGENLHEAHARLGGYPADLANRIGRALGNAQRLLPRSLPAAEYPNSFARIPPWVMTVGEDAAVRLDELPGGHRATLLAIRNNSDLLQGLARLGRAWRLEMIIHGDIRGDNILLDAGSGELPALRLVDWELSDVGDPMWDVAGVFATYLEYWLLALHLPTPRSRTEFTELDQQKLRDEVWQALHAFWQGYRESRGQGDESIDEIMKRWVQLTGARFVRSAFDVVAGMHHLTEPALILLESAALIFTDPERAERELFGFLRG